MNLAEIFGTLLIRYSVSGTLILLYAIADRYARRLGGVQPTTVPGTVWLRVTLIVCVVAFYALLSRTGGAIWGGVGNLAGIGLAGVAMAFRIATAKGSSRLRQPQAAARLLFYAALPLALGIPLGWLVLTLPAFVALAINAVREDRILAEQLGEVWTDRMATTHRLIPGVW
jgi:protein-S-isoprenylcysteine O-methyltransferase Ste14